MRSLRQFIEVALKPLFRKRLEKLFLFVSQLAWDGEVDSDIEIASGGTLQVLDAVPLETYLCPVFCSRRNLDLFCVAFKGGKGDRGTECRLGEFNLLLQNQVVTLPLKERVIFNGDVEIEVARGAP